LVCTVRFSNHRFRQLDTPLYHRLRKLPLFDLTFVKLRIGRRTDQVMQQGCNCNRQTQYFCTARFLKTLLDRFCNICAWPLNTASRILIASARVMILQFYRQWDTHLSVLYLRLISPVTDKVRTPRSLSRCPAGLHEA
jgi:hypothetical protein